MTATYRLRRGRHQAGSGSDLRNYCSRNPSGQWPEGYGPGDDMVVSATDLVALFGAEKFEKVADTPAVPAAPAEVKPAASNGPDLQAMTVAQLRTLAEEEEIDLDGTRLKSEIIEALERVLV